MQDEEDRAEDDAGEVQPVGVQKMIAEQPEQVSYDHRRGDHEADLGVARHRHPCALVAFVRFILLHGSFPTVAETLGKPSIRPLDSGLLDWKGLESKTLRISIALSCAPIPVL
jgi:hypothetical protein